MTIAVITHSNEGIRVKIGDRLEVYANAMYLAEEHARFKSEMMEQAKVLADLCLPLRRLANHMTVASGKDTGLAKEDHVRIFDQGPAEIEAMIDAVGMLVKELAS